MTAAYTRWVRDGSPWKFGRAAKAVAGHLRAHGYTVYMQGNQQHLEHDPPEDHTPYSATGWPANAPYPYCLALDIMPPRPGQQSLITGRLLPSLQQLSAQLYQDKQAGHPGAAFVKYMNWEPERDNGGPCYQDSWRPGHARRNSTDRGHTHISSRTDYATSGASDDYDLVARVTGDDMPLNSDDKAWITGEIREQANKGFVDVLGRANRAARGITTVVEDKKTRNLTEFELAGDAQILGMLRNAVGGPTEDDVAGATATLLAAINGDNLDAGQVAAQVLAGLDPSKIAAAIPSNMAIEVADELARRLNA